MLLLGWRQFGQKGLLGAIIVGCAVAVAVWYRSPYLHERIGVSVRELQTYRATSADNSTGEHLEFLRKSLSFFAAEPIFGHGTGSIPAQFRRAAVGSTGAGAVTSVNPRNQIFAVAVQLGSIGAVLLVAMWTAHFMLFQGRDLTALVGAIIVVQNVISSLFNSHLFDFTQGWLYVFGVGVCGGIAGRESDQGVSGDRKEGRAHSD